jgi:hypothetical protein
MAVCGTANSTPGIRGGGPVLVGSCVRRASGRQGHHRGCLPRLSSRSRMVRCPSPARAGGWFERRRGHDGKWFRTRSRRPRRRHLCQRPRYPPRAQATGRRRSTSRTARSCAGAARDRAACVCEGASSPGPGPGQVVLRVLRAFLRHLADQHRAVRYSPPGRRTYSTGAAGRRPSAALVSGPRCPVPGAGRPLARPRPAPGWDQTRR